MKDVFPIVRSYFSHVPLYPACMHSFMLASKVYDPLTAEITRKAPSPMRYYNEAIQKSCFVLRIFIRNASSRKIQFLIYRLRTDAAASVFAAPQEA